MERWTNTERKYRQARSLTEAGIIIREKTRSPYEADLHRRMVSCESVRQSFASAARKQLHGRQG